MDAAAPREEATEMTHRDEPPKPACRQCSLPLPPWGPVCEGCGFVAAHKYDPLTIHAKKCRACGLTEWDVVHSAFRDL